MIKKTERLTKIIFLSFFFWNEFWSGLQQLAYTLDGEFYGQVNVNKKSHWLQVSANKLLGD